MQKSVSPSQVYFEFQDKFPDEQSCLEHLAEIKWRNGFTCVKCGLSIILKRQFNRK